MFVDLCLRGKSVLNLGEARHLKTEHHQKQEQVIGELN